jgi:hypothetical protein
MKLTFPSVLRDLRYPENYGPDDRRAVTLTLAEAQELCASYLREMYNGVRYDEMLREPWNLAEPNIFTEQNIEAVNLMNARFSYAKAKHLIGQPIPALEMIPLDADLFATDRYVGIAADIVCWLDDFDGLDVSVATKLLHMKRPAMIPIFDALARRAIDIPWRHGAGGAAYEPLFGDFRDFASHGDNAVALDLLRNWINAETESGRRFGLPRVRVLDTLAWSVIWYRDPFA